MIRHGKGGPLAKLVPAEGIKFFPVLVETVDLPCSDVARGLYLANGREPPTTAERRELTALCVLDGEVCQLDVSQLICNHALQASREPGKLRVHTDNRMRNALTAEYIRLRYKD